MYVFPLLPKIWAHQYVTLAPNDASDHLTTGELLLESQGENPVIVCR